MTTEPTDAELKAMWQLHAADIGGIFYYARAVLAKWGQPAQAAEPVAWLDPWTGTKVTTDYDAYGKHGIPLYTAPQPVARDPLPKFLALKFHARRDKKATVTLLFPGHEAADAWVRGTKVGQHGEATPAAHPDAARKQGGV